ncbi:hypothetical protein BKG87_22210 [Mycobacteroides chelonae]|nr:hypothetical protein BKG87_22210 [Mycobacteroides chelonae]
MLGVAITTHNRRDVLLNALTHWIEHTPADVPIVVVDDGSDEPLCLEGWRGVPLHRVPSMSVVRHPQPRGIAVAKNRCIAELMDLWCDHLFLADDDVWPTTDEWWKPYIESPEPHLSFQWPSGGRHSVTHQDEQHFAIGFPRGVLLYAERRVIDTVGGMDTGYGAHGGEHVDWSQRIHDAGLTRWPFADVRGSHNLIYSRDKAEGNRTGSSRFELHERARMCEANGNRWGHKHPTWPYFPYRESEGVQDYRLGPYFPPLEHYSLLRHVVGLKPSGVALEFGVGKGESTRIMAEHMPVIGFDSFVGLPEDWREGFPKGSFAHKPPAINNTRLVIGRYADTLPGFTFPDCGLVHIDCDLYSSAATALEHLQLQSGTYVVFDEWHGYDGCEGHEMKAWREYVDRTAINWCVVGHSHEAWAIRIT